MKFRFPCFLGITLSTLALVFMGCGGSTVTGTMPSKIVPGGPCTNGQTGLSEDGCNTCTCTGGAWACTEKACVDSGVGDSGPAKGCGGWLGDTCSANEYCAYTEGQLCGAADASSVCKVRPSGCTKEYEPVCGCDRKTYGNACTAAAAGTGVYSKGACPEN